LKIDKEIDLTYFPLSLNTRFTLQETSSFAIILNTYDLTDIETIILEFSKENNFQKNQLFMLLKILDPVSQSEFVIKKKTEIPIPDKVEELSDDLVLNLKIENDGTTEIII